MTKTTLIKG